MKNDDLIHIYTDGACRGNPGPGGWGAILICGPYRKEIKGGNLLSTNNIMELTAVIKALELIKKPSDIEITTDSKYVKNGITSWIFNWKSKGWKTANKKPVKNKDLWINLDNLCSEHNIKWKWVRGHTGHLENELADKLANEGINNLYK
tara:strand:+ start:157 stop:603 length:447 start_codon:yes stop_codon:yes gene_type:complete